MKTAFAACLIACATAASAAPLGFSSGSVQNSASLSGHANGSWTVSADGTRVTQTTNGQPSLFLLPGTSGAQRIQGQVRSTDADDDFFGFAFGVGGGDWLLVDWKQATQTVNFTGGAASATPAGTARRGLAASRVSGTPTGDEFWAHTNYTQDSGGGLSELARGATLGSSGWARNTWYSFDMMVLADSVTVAVDGVEQFRVAGNYADGQFGFYNFSQPATEFRGFSSVSAVPEPSALLLAAGGLGVLGLLRRRRSSRSSV